jgi:hypothetical protein
MTTMKARREGLYRFPWSTTDSQSGWVEVTDRCDMACPGCYRSSIEGPRRLEDVARDIVACQELTNCDSLSIAGGEPLTYPHLADVVRFIARRGMKPVILTNGLKLTPARAAELKQAGLAKIHFHVDSVQQRPGWTGCTEAQVNELRQQFADMLWNLGGVQCGFHATVYRSNLSQIGDVVRFCRANIHKVQHLSLIAFRALPRTESLEYRVRGRLIPQDCLPSASARPDEIGITTHEMLEVLQAQLSWMRPCAFIGGAPEPRVDKHLVVVNVGTPREVLGSLGARTVELVQVVYHLFNGRYCSFLRRTEAGRRLFVLGLVDPEVRRAFRRYLEAVFRRPGLALDRIYTQSINLQQPIEILEGRTNLCDTCVNPMAFGGRLIPPCQLDDYRLFGAALEPGRVNPRGNAWGDRP